MLKSANSLFRNLIISISPPFLTNHDFFNPPGLDKPTCAKNSIKQIEFPTIKTSSHTNHDNIDAMKL